ncbi:hypothetical protein LTR15_006114 [Elasticomyces elasticus]|nr:hypothetical protein LTR15_006114 [Elasticomyces elasticus]
MADYDSDSSGADDIATNVLLGYASKEPTVDNFSQLGGHPTWLDGVTAPGGSLAKCKACNGLLTLLLQLYADLPERFPAHERRLYVWACKRKACRRKQGSVRTFRAIRSTAAAVPTEPKEGPAEAQPLPAKPAVDLGGTLFGVKSSGTIAANPFASLKSGANAGSNPFASRSAQDSPDGSVTDSLAQTFAQKARISSPQPSTQTDKAPSAEASWPELSSFPEPYPAYHIDADKEYLEPESQIVPANARLDRGGDGESSNAAEEKAAFESSMDRTFQRFADRIAQNPEQILRYEFDGQPLLYSRKDAVGKLLDSAPEQGSSKVQIASSSGSTSKMPRCSNCGAVRVFECQLTPHAIAQLEADEMSIDGMDWGTILLGACNADCQQHSKKHGEVGYVEEWVGVQWE